MNSRALAGLVAAMIVSPAFAGGTRPSSVRVSVGVTTEGVDAMRTNASLSMSGRRKGSPRCRDPRRGRIDRSGASLHLTDLVHAVTRNAFDLYREVP